MKKILMILTIFLLTDLSVFGQKTLPDLMIKNLDGKPVNAQSLASSGKITIISFWATWCAPCQKELQAISVNYETWQKKYNVELVAVTIDNIQGLAKVKPLMAQKRWSYSAFSDMNSQLLQQLGGQNVPFTALVNQKGQVVYVHNGFKEGDEIELENKISELVIK